MDLFSLAAKLTLDTGEYEHGIESARSAAANFAKGLTSVVTAVSTTDRAVNNAADSAENLGTETSNAADGVSELRQAESDVARTSDNAADSIGSTADAVSELQDSSESVTRTIGESANSMSDATDEAKGLSRELDRAESEFDDTEDAVDDYTESADDAAKSTRKLGDEEEKTTKKTSTFGDALKAILTSDAIKAGLSAIVNGVKAVGRAFINLGKQSVEAYANYEQLVGGVETLFKKNAGDVQKYAANAYKTAGMSANQYMETVTSFSASLLQGLSGDTAKAAKIADVAISDMSDNANKMGTDMQSIQNAYQGFAKQNYTINLMSAA